eukprot:CAMPEP_0185589252 /NCGR_PEP_ID=MMETSP0434-20130131/56188_1 /TAXON_ID=626734 ORGANISM="Favella taraikaensis, Strain Fe Narragansett Bay" /NCGR_SAMPLE_ID=MMETSP0434 /ASSEMBLY_ACC=CAM_ASM_000379 /LENGTH=79 /DNA_ID=CAMNT_0028212485 /DNA_START=29 /DNA_END=265 /DNA_ORIENTATION=-
MRLSTVTYFRIYLKDFIANVTALSLSLISGVALFMSGYHGFTQNQALVKNLYGHTRNENKSDLTVSADEAKDGFKERLE